MQLQQVTNLLMPKPATPAPADMNATAATDTNVTNNLLMPTPVAVTLPGTQTTAMVRGRVKELG